jgi:hypothetical protein
VSFEEDLMALANRVQQRAVWVSVQNKEGDKTDLFARNGVEGYYAGVAELYRPYSQMPDPAAFLSVRDEVSYALACLSQGEASQPVMDPIPFANAHLAMIPGAETYLADWTGRAALEFTETFVRPFPLLTTNQYLLAAILRSGIEAQVVIWEAARRDIMEIGYTTLAALDGLEGCKHDDGGLGVVLQVASVVATVAAFFVTRGGAKIALEVVGAVGGIVGDVIGNGEAPAAPTNRFGIGGAHTWDVIASMSNAIRHLRGTIEEQERRVQAALHAATTVVAGQPGLFVVPRPALAGATAATIASPEYMGYST